VVSRRRNQSVDMSSALAQVANRQTESNRGARIPSLGNQIRLGIGTAMADARAFVVADPSFAEVSKERTPSPRAPLCASHATQSFVAVMQLRLTFSRTQSLDL